MEPEDLEQVEMDVTRSCIDGLHEISPPWFDEAWLAASLRRLLHAWCCRRPSGYCQGMNFIGAVLLVVSLHGVGVWGEQGARRAEEAAFWTFAALVELVLPTDFYSPPSMAGLQLDVRVLLQLSRTEIPQLAAAFDMLPDDLLLPPPSRRGTPC